MASKVRMSFSVMVLSVFWMSAEAATLVHYPMENLEPMSLPVGATIPDASPTGAHPATLAEYVYGTHRYYAPVIESATGFAANGIRDGENGLVLRNGNIISFTQANDNVDGNGAALRIEESADDRSLHLQTFTIEFLWKCAVSNRRWASPLSRVRVDPATPPVVKTGEEASTLTLYVNNNDAARTVRCITTVMTGGGLVTQTQSLGPGLTIVDGNWHHVALTLDGTTHTLTLYVDGEKNGSVVLDGALVYQDANPWVFGGHGYFGWQAGGSMDEIRISDKVLAPSEFLRVADVPEVLARYSLVGTPETTLAIGDTFPNVSAAETMPLKVSPIVHPAAEKYYAAGKVRFHAPRILMPDESLGAVQEGLGGAVGLNAAALAFTQPTETGEDAHGATLQVVDAEEDTALHLQEFTIEYFWKAKFSQHWAAPLSRTRVDAAGNPLGTTGDVGKDASTLTFYLNYSTDTLNCIYTAQGPDGIVTESKVIHTGFRAKFNDSIWHHHAVTLNAYSHRLTYYVDGSIIGSLTLPGPLVYEKGNAWSFGGYGFFGWQAGGAMDEIRISPYVRTPASFLRPTSSVPAKGTWAYFPLEGDCLSMVHPEFGPDSAEVSAVVSPLLAAGNLAFVDDRPGGRIMDHAGNQIRLRNPKAMALSNLESGLVLPSSSYRFDRSNGLTCEFFFKATLEDIREGAWGVLLAWRNPSQTAFPICFQENGKGLLNLRADTDLSSIAITSLKSPFDGNWHHVACTRELTPDVRSTIVSFYIDGELQGTQTKSGVMPVMKESVLEVGTRTKSLLIDEVRFSNGVLHVSDFLNPRPSAGLVMILR